MRRFPTTQPHRAAGRRVSPYEVRLDFWLNSMLGRWPPIAREYRFALADGRKWRLDWAFPDLRVGIEFDGGARLVRWQTNPRSGRPQPVAVGRHATAADYEKLNYLSEHGWRVLRFNPDMLKDPGAVMLTIERTLRAAHLGSRFPLPNELPIPDPPEPTPPR